MNMNKIFMCEGWFDINCFVVIIIIYNNLLMFENNLIWRWKGLLVIVFVYEKKLEYNRVCLIMCFF